MTFLGRIGSKLTKMDLKKIDFSKLKLTEAKNVFLTEEANFLREIFDIKAMTDKKDINIIKKLYLNDNIDMFNLLGDYLTNGTPETQNKIFNQMTSGSQHRTYPGNPENSHPFNFAVLGPAQFQFTNVYKYHFWIIILGGKLYLSYRDKKGNRGIDGEVLMKDNGGLSKQEMELLNRYNVRNYDDVYNNPNKDLVISEHIKFCLTMKNFFSPDNIKIAESAIVKNKINDSLSGAGHKVFNRKI